MVREMRTAVSYGMAQWVMGIKVWSDYILFTNLMY